MLGKTTSMSSDKPFTKFIVACTVVLGFLAITDPALAASKEKLLYSFCTQTNCTDGGLPGGSLISDSAGNLYGVTVWGGTGQGCGNGGCGTLFALTPRTGGTWTETVLYNFCPSSNCTDGTNPQGNLISDATGNFYGVTRAGGAFYGGTVFKLSPGANGTWAETVLYSFCSAKNCADGEWPSGGLIVDAAGDLYGMTSAGGSGSDSDCGIFDCGTVFELSPQANGTWTEEVLYDFCSASNCTDGAVPFGGVIFDGNGNLYGTTTLGGASNPKCGQYGCGTVFELVFGTSGNWSEKVLHKFRGSKDGYSPGGGLTFDTTGNLYGTTSYGGGSGPYSCRKTGCGTVFQLTPLAKGGWKETILTGWGTSRHNRPPGFPTASPIFDQAGNLYCSTNGGAYGDGTAIELSPGTGGNWNQVVLHTFDYDRRGSDGVSPYSLSFGRAGKIYGTTLSGGTGSGIRCDNIGCGTVFEITP